RERGRDGGAERVRARGARRAGGGLQKRHGARARLPGGARGRARGAPGGRVAGGQGELGPPFNSTMELEPDCLGELVAALEEHPEAGWAAAKLRDFEQREP